MKSFLFVKNFINMMLGLIFNEFKGTVNDGEYVGQFTIDENGKRIPHGTGKLTYFTRIEEFDTYEGQFYHGQPHGHGRLTWISGDYYDGKFVDGNPDGYGIINYKNGTQIHCHVFDFIDQEIKNMKNVNMKVKSTINLKIVYPNGNVYTGDYSQGKFNGKGTYLMSGMTYTGDFVDNYWHGFGKLHFADGSVLEGQFTNGMEFYGKITYSNGHTFEGHISNEMVLNGTVKYANGCVFEGTFTDNNLISGKYVWKNGSTYIGDFNKNIASNRGIYYAPSNHKSINFQNKKI